MAKKGSNNPNAPEDVATPQVDGANQAINADPEAATETAEETAPVKADESAKPAETVENAKPAETAGKADKKANKPNPLKTKALELMKAHGVKEIWRTEADGYWFTRKEYFEQHHAKVGGEFNHFEDNEKK